MTTTLASSSARRIAAILTLVSASLALLVAPSTAAAGPCGSQTNSTHTSSWAVKKLYLRSTGCIAAGSTTVHGTGRFEVAGNGGASWYRMRIVITDVTAGRSQAYSKVISWSEQALNSPDWICVAGAITIKTNTPTDITSCVSGMGVVIASPKVPRVAGHVYTVTAWDEVDMLNDGKGLYVDAKSTTHWVA